MHGYETHTKHVTPTDKGRPKFKTCILEFDWKEKENLEEREVV